MSRDELRIQAIKIMAESLRPACGYRDFDWDKMAERALDALGEAGFRVIGPLTEEMCSAGLNYYCEPLTAYDAIAAAGDLTKKPE